MRASLLGALLFSSTALLAYDFSPRTDRAIAAIDMRKWQDDTEHLSSYNRYYRGEEILAARDWLKSQFEDLGLTTTEEQFTISGHPGFNIVGEIAGSETKDEVYIVGAHYDSISEDPRRLAPGAEDNASGTAALLTIAQALVHERPKATIRFIAFSGEEAGLVGSKYYVKQLLARGEKNNIKGVLIMDMIGFSSDDDLDALIETASRNQALVELLAAAREHYARGRTETSFRYWGSDHVPFIQNGFNAALLIENDYDAYDDYHRSTDRFENLNPAMAEVIIKMVTGTLGYWTL